MSKMTQKEAVFSAVSQVLSEAGISFDVGNTKVKELMTKEYRAQVNHILFQAFKAGEIDLDTEKSDSELKEYTSGLQTNWLNKDKRLNGNTAHVAKNPGSRTGSSDAQIKALRALMSTKNDVEEIAEIQSYIDDRLTEIAASKPSKKVEVDYSSLPAELQAKYAAN